MASRLGEEKSDAGKFQRPKVRPVTFRRVRLDVGEERELLEDFYRV